MLTGTIIKKNERVKYISHLFYRQMYTIKLLFIEPLVKQISRRFNPRKTTLDSCT